MKSAFFGIFLLGLFLSAQSQENPIIDSLINGGLSRIAAEVEFENFKVQEAKNKKKSPHLIYNFLDVLKKGGKDLFMEYVDLNYGREIDVFLNSGRSFGTGYIPFYIKVPRDSFETYYDESLSKIKYDSIVTKKESRVLKNTQKIEISEIYEFYLNGEKIREISILWEDSILARYEDTDQFGDYIREIPF